jgi:hypothetical protein
MANPIIPQGNLNKLRASIVWVSFPNLNVTASYLGKDGISLAFEGQATATIETMTGGVQSPEPYQKTNISIHLLRSQALANAYKNQIETNTLMGDCTLYPDSSILSPYILTNCSITNVNTLNMNGSDPGWVLVGSGFYNINSNLWNL